MSRTCIDEVLYESSARLFEHGIAVHFDVDVLDPTLYDFLLFNDPSLAPGAFDGVAKGRMRFEEVAGILNAVNAETDIVGLTIAEFTPWNVIDLSRSLRALPLLC